MSHSKIVQDLSETHKQDLHKQDLHKQDLHKPIQNITYVPYESPHVSVPIHD